MNVDTSKAQIFEWPHLLGVHLNVTPSAITPEMEVARIQPDSPECVFMGDSGVPKTLHVNFQEDGSYESIPNSDWTEESAPYSTGFFLFVDEEEIRQLAPHLLIEEVTEQ